MRLISSQKSGCPLSTSKVYPGLSSSQKFSIVSSLSILLLIAVQLPTSEAVWFFNSGFSSLGRAAGPAQAITSPQVTDLSEDSKKTTIALEQQTQDQQALQQQQLDSTVAEGIKEPHNNQLASSSSVSSSGFSIGGIRPSMIASLLNTVGDTGFRYFNIEDQCRNRAACDLGFMLYKKLSFAHNWLIRTSVRSLTDMNNMYTQSWMEGMMGRNCTTVYMSCRQSPLDGLMNIVQLNLQ